jgi:hypothetical protein
LAHPANDVAAPGLISGVADAMHALLDAPEGSEEEREFASITDAIEAYETLRWPTGKVEEGKG